MWVNYPPGFDPTKRWPVYLLLHGGPHNGVTDSFTFRWKAQVFSGWGYVTAWHNFHGSSGFGQAFADSINPDWATSPTRTRSRRRSGWPRSRGWTRAGWPRAAASYGGYLATLLLGREHPFKTLVAHAAVYNLYSMTASDGGANQPRFGGYWEKERDLLLKKMSPHFGAPRFKTPTLVIHGALDYRVTDNHGLEVFHMLQQRGVQEPLHLLPEREPLDPEAAELAPLVPVHARLAEGDRRRGARRRAEARRRWRAAEPDYDESKVPPYVLPDPARARGRRQGGRRADLDGEAAAGAAPAVRDARLRTHARRWPAAALHGARARRGRRSAARPRARR